MKKLGLVTKLIIISLSVVFATAFILVTITAIRFDQTYEKLIMEDLKATVEHMQSQFEHEFEGDWTLENGVLHKGGTDVKGVFEEEMDELRAETGIGNVMASAKEIDERVGELNSAKDVLNGIIEDLFAISEENEASTEETNASMQELSATFSVINENAEELKVLAADLSDTIGYFS